MHKEFHEEDIDRYILGKMDADELSSFEKAMKDNPELRQEVVLMKGIKASLERRAKNLEQMKEWHRYQIQSKHVACGGYSHIPAPSRASEQAPAEPERGSRKWRIIILVLIGVLCLIRILIGLFRAIHW